jgi:hypothetical protein
VDPISLGHCVGPWVAPSIRIRDFSFHPRIPIGKEQKGTDHDEHEHHGEVGRQCKYLKAATAQGPFLQTVRPGTRQWDCEHLRRTVWSVRDGVLSQGRHIPYFSSDCNSSTSTRRVSPNHKPRNLPRCQHDSHGIACHHLPAVVPACAVTSSICISSQHG